MTGTDEDIEDNKREYYLAAIEAMDSEIGRLLASMSEEERNNTLIVYIGDNGTPAAVIDTDVFTRSHSKNSLYEGGIRIPMFVSGKGVTRMGQRETALINTTDFYSTFAQFLGDPLTQINNSHSFLALLSTEGEGPRQFNYAEFESNNVTGWVVRNNEHKLLHFEDGTQALYKVDTDLNEANNLLLSGDNQTALISPLQAYAELIREEDSDNSIDITNVILTKRSANCNDYVHNYHSTATDIHRNQIFNGSLNISVQNNRCTFQTNNIPNHDFNDGASSFVNNVSAQANTLTITTTPNKAANNTALSLTYDNAILLNGVKVDLLPAACFGVGDGKIGCNNINQPWRYDPAFDATTFRIDTHNAHTQANGEYHYHGKPNALYEDGNANATSPLIGFAADGFPIYGPYFEKEANIRKALSSYQLKVGNRPTGSENPQGAYDGTFRDDYEYVEGAGDLDECNGMTIDGVYGYYITDGFPYVLNCFKGTVDESFRK